MATAKGYKTGDRVKSNLMGYYYGLPGTVLIRKINPINGHPRYKIALDIGKELYFDEACLSPLADQSEAEETERDSEEPNS